MNPLTTLRCKMGLLLLGSCLWLVSCKTTTTFRALSLDNSRIAVIDSVCNAHITNYHYPGLAVAVIDNGRMWTKGYGYADVEKKIPVDPDDHLFRIGSISKTVTAAALARLYEQDKIELDVPISFYYDAIPADKKDITLRQLAGHTAGIRHYKGIEFMSNLAYDRIDDAMEVFIYDTLLYTPGSEFHYTTYGWTLLSAVMEDAVDIPFLKIIDDEVSKPLHLEDLKADQKEAVHHNRVNFYHYQDGKHAVTPPADLSNKWAGGGFLCSAADLSRFGYALTSPGYLQYSTLEEFTTGQMLPDQSPTNYGIGFSLGKDAAGRSWYGHSGGSVGGTSMLMIYPEEDLVVVTLINLSSAQMEGLAWKIADLIEAPKKLK